MFDFVKLFNRKRDLLSILESMDKDYFTFLLKSQEPYLGALKKHLGGSERVWAMTQVMLDSPDVAVRRALSTLDIPKGTMYKFNRSEVRRAKLITLTWMLQTARKGLTKIALSHGLDYQRLRPDLNRGDAEETLGALYLESVEVRTIDPLYRSGVYALTWILRRAHGR